MIPLTEDNPYARGFVFSYGDGKVSLQRKAVTYIPTPNDETYEVVEGDTLWAISSRKYGKSAWWWLIYEVNRSVIVNPFFLNTGEILLIPNLTQFKIQNP
jgi:nucleoid-associated protein YgaU